MMETSFQGIDVPPLSEELYASQGVHHVPEQVFRMSPVYTAFLILSHSMLRGLTQDHSICA
jgi:hypothetical protein